MAKQQKEVLKEQSKKHYEIMDKLYSQDTQKSFKNTVIWGENGEQAEDVELIPHYDEVKDKYIEYNEDRIHVDDLDTVASIIKHTSGKTAVLNFASYKNPGGGFLSGATAQEESLCRASNLYNVLEKCDEFYKYNAKHKNRALYEDRALYTPGIIFFDDKTSGDIVSRVPADVITCAAPNKKAAEEFAHIKDYDNLSALDGRIKFILDVAEANEVDTLILGAFGCGAFGQDSEDVAKIFRFYLLHCDYSFKNVYFSVPQGKKNDNKYKIFKTILGSLDSKKED